MEEEQHHTPEFRPRPPSRALFAAIRAVVLIVVVAVGFWIHLYVNAPHPNKDTYQAVFLNNNQVYFGKLSGQGDYLTLSDVYYVKVNQAPQTQASGTPQQAPQAQTTLVKLGSELHSPEDTLHLAKGQMLFYENLKSDSQVIARIQEDKAKGSK